MLLDEKEVQVEMANSLDECKETVIVLSAFIKHGAFEWFIKQIKSREVDVVVVARWRLDDLVSHVSDLSVYKQCKDLGWTFKVDQRLHSKLFLIDSSTAYVGSSNLTGAGLGLTKKSNFELSTKIKITDIDIDKVNKYVDSCITMTDDIYDQMKSFVDSIEPPKKIPCKWPSSIKNLLEQEIDYLWVNELFFVNFVPGIHNKPPWESELHHDLYLLDTSISEYMAYLLMKTHSPNNPKAIIFEEKLRDNFKKTKVIRWLKKQLLKEKSKSLRFGAISRLLHDALLDNPKPYRKEVKDFQVNLFNWIKYLELTEFKFEKYNYSESISLVGNFKNT